MGVVAQVWWDRYYVRITLTEQWFSTFFPSLPSPGGKPYLNLSLTRGMKNCGIRPCQVVLNYGGSQSTVLAKIFFTSPCPKTVSPPRGVTVPLWRIYTSPRPLLRHLDMPSLGLEPKICISFKLSRELECIWSMSHKEPPIVINFHCHTQTQLTG